MYELSESKNPNFLGKKKDTKYGMYHTIRLNDSYRLAYNTNFKTHEIVIIRVGTHDSTY
jgi:mRNA-degrading endonuclease RelE of RelBE toxin-antitoxin system